jgi:uncharacterized protein (TIGR02757 family)
MKYSSILTKEEQKDILAELHDRYNRLSFIEEDPISIPHSFSVKEDIEISGFLTAIIAWGQRAQILKKSRQLMQMMDNSPCDFVLHASEEELKRLSSFYYRTFKSVDLFFIIRVLKRIYSSSIGLEEIFTSEFTNTGSVESGLIKLYKIFHQTEHENRSMKHIANISKGSSAKRLNMFLRWMVRKDGRGVDFGIWKNINSSALFVPLDVHTGRTARLFGLLERKQNDWKAAKELTNNLREFDLNDPVKYDFALFGAGVNGLI